MGHGRWSNETIPIGRDNANNITSTTNVVANIDGSVLERLEFIQSDIERDNGRGGNIWYLDSGAAAGGDGTSWTLAWDTLAEAITGASSYDTILVKDGSTYDIGAAQNIGVQGLHIIGTGAKDQNFAKAMIYGGSGHFLTINAHEVWIDNISFVSPSDNYDAIRIATTASYFKVKITNCKFDLSSGEYCIYAGGTFDAPDLVIENNLFRSFSTGGVYIDTTRAQVRSNRFLILNAGTTAIEHVPNGGNRPETVIVDNEIYGVNSTDIGIEITNTPTEALFHISGNKVINCATPVTESKYTSWYDCNYWGVNDSRYHSMADSDKYPGRVFFVDSDQAAAGDGRCWASAYTTLTAAVAAADTRNDTILVAAANTCYTEAAVLDITTVGTQIIGMGNKEPNHAKALILAPTTPGHFMTINAHECLIDNMSFASPADGYDAIRIGTSAEPFKVKIVNCKFDLTNGEICVRMGAPSYDAPDCVIENNLFRSFSTCGVYASATRAVIKNNTFLVDANKIGIDIYQHEGDRPDLVIKDNVITGANSGDTGIKFSYTNSEDEITIVGNNVTNCETPVTAGKYASWYEGNYWGIDVTKVTLVPGRTYALAKTATSDDDDLFVVTGGPIFIIKFQGIVTTEIAAQQNRINIELDSAGVPHLDTKFSTALDITGDVVGTRYTFNASPTSTMIPVSNATAGTSNIMMPWFCGIGTVEQANADSTCAGVIVWYMYFTPLTIGVTVTVAS